MGLSLAKCKTVYKEGTVFKIQYIANGKENNERIGKREYGSIYIFMTGFF